MNLGIDQTAFLFLFNSSNLVILLQQILYLLFYIFNQYLINLSHVKYANKN